MSTTTQPSATLAPLARTAVTNGMRRKTTIPFVLGEFGLFKVRLDALVFEPRFTREGQLPPELPSDAIAVPAGVTTVFYPSHPGKPKLPALSFLARALRYVPFAYPRHYVDLEGRFEQYVERFSTKERKNLARAVRKFEESGGGLRVFRTAEGMDSFYEQALALSKLTYQKNLLDGGLPENAEYRRKIVQLAGSGEARGYLLLHGETAVAFALCMVDGGHVLYDHVGHHPAYKKLSPGTALLVAILESLFAERAHKVFDFGAGEAWYKQHFATAQWDCCDVYLFRRSPVGLAIALSHHALRTTSQFAVWLLARLGIKDAVKKRIRAHAEAS